MDVVPKNKQDDLLWFALGSGAITYLIFQNAIASFIAMALFVIGFVLYLNKAKIKTWYENRYIKDAETEDVVEETPKEKPVKTVGKGRIELGKYVSINSGKRELTKIPVKIELEDLGHTFIMGMTGYGKTTLLYWLIAEIIEKYDSEDVRLAFSDAKGVSFNIYSQSKHLFAPIATDKDETTALIEIAVQEMNRRRDLFKSFANDRLCTNVQQYEKITGEKLPYIIFVFDELADAVEKDSDAEKQLITLAKMSRSTGIRLFMATQRPTVAGISHEVQSQCQTIISGYMKTSREYGTIAQIPANIYKYMTAIPGLSVIFTPKLAPSFLEKNPDCEGWGLFMGNYLHDEDIERIAEKDRDRTIDLGTLKREKIEFVWEGTEENKFYVISLLENELGRDVEIADMIERFKISYPTARSWREKYYDTVS